MSVGLGKAREIIHSRGGADLLLNHLFTVSQLVMISATIIM